MNDVRRSAEMDDDEIFDDEGPVTGEPTDEQIDVDFEQADENARAPEIEGEKPKDPEPDPDDDPDKTATDKTSDDADKAKKGDEDEDTDEYGRKVQRRINQEVGKRKAAETKAEKLEREVAELRKRVGAGERQYVETSITGLESTIERLGKEYAEAIEEGDTKRQVELQNELVDARVELRQANGYKQQMEERQPEPEPRHQATPEPSGDPLDALPPKSRTWAEDRGLLEWEPEEINFAFGIDAKMTREGYDPTTDEYFEEMDRRISKVFPHLYDEDGDTPAPSKKDPPRKQTQNAAPNAGVSKVQPGKKPGTVTLDKNDLSNMRRFGLDPNNAEHCRQYAREKQSGEARV